MKKVFTVLFFPLILLYHIALVRNKIVKIELGKSFFFYGLCSIYFLNLIRVLNFYV